MVRFHDFCVCICMAQLALTTEWRCNPGCHLQVDLQFMVIKQPCWSGSWLASHSLGQNILTQHPNQHTSSELNMQCKNASHNSPPKPWLCLSEVWELGQYPGSGNLPGPLGDHPPWRLCSLAAIRCPHQAFFETSIDETLRCAVPMRLSLHGKPVGDVLWLVMNHGCGSGLNWHAPLLWRQWLTMTMATCPWRPWMLQW